MQIVTFLFLCGCAFAAGGLASPKKAQQVDISVILNTDGESALSLCSEVSFTEKEVFQDSLVWSWSGLQRLSMAVYKEYNVQASMNAARLRFRDSNAAKLTSKRLLSRENKIERVTTEAIQCVARRMVLNDMSTSGALCSCLSNHGPEHYCNIMDAMTLALHCHDQMAAKVDKSKLCPVLLTKTLGVELSKMCSGWIAGIVSALNFDLFTLNYPDSTPNVIDNKVISQEARAYYIGLKAIERFTRWTDAHLFCADSGHTNLEDIEIIESWESRVYFWIKDVYGGSRIPIAMVAQQDQGTGNKTNYENTLVVVRNIKTNYEARLSLTYQMQKRPLEKVSVHQGYDSIASQISLVLSRYLKKHYSSLTPTRPKITSIGHGTFGSGIAAIIARDLANQFQIANGGMLFEHNLIAYGGGPVGDFAFTDELKTKVNVRNIVSDNLAMSDFPCETVKTCSYKHLTPLASPNPRSGPFVRLPGQVMIDSQHLADDAWRTNATKLETLANMHCATSCWLSTKFCSDDPSPRCSVSNCGVFLSEEVHKTLII